MRDFILFFSNNIKRDVVLYLLFANSFGYIYVGLYVIVTSRFLNVEFTVNNF